MSGPGFDWLNIPPTHSGSRGPAPAVSFGYLNPNRSAPSASDSQTFHLANSLAEHLVRTHALYRPHSTSSSPAPLMTADSDDLSIPLSLTAQELTLGESKTYMRWYSDILARTNARTVSMADVYQFLNNFRISAAVKEKINKIFHKILRSINIGEFFALLRLVSHTLSGKEPQRRLIKMEAPVPTPPSILSKKRQNDDQDDEYLSPAQNDAPQDKIDLDSFTQFMLTGERPGDRVLKKLKKQKSVKFSDQVVTDIHDMNAVASPISSPLPQPLDYSLPMDQLLTRMAQGGANTIQPPSMNTQEHRDLPDAEEREILRDMESQINHFQNLNSVDTASIGGVPSNIHLHGRSGFLLPNPTGTSTQTFSPSPTVEEQQQRQFLQPNMTGPAQMARLYANDSLLQNPSNEGDHNDYLGPDMTPLRPNVTGPADMAKLFSPPASQYPQEQAPKISLQSFTDQMTGNTLANTIENSRMDTGSPSRIHASSFSNRPLPPPPVPNTRRMRSVSSPTPRIVSPSSNLGNTVTQSAGSDQHSPLRFAGSPDPVAPPIPARSPLLNAPVRSGRLQPPPPPPSRRRGSSVVSNPDNSPSPAPPLPPKVSNEDSLQKQPVFYNSNLSNDSTANILDDLKALQAEVDKIKTMTGGF